MKMFKKQFIVSTFGGKTTYINILDQVNEAIEESKVQSGLIFILTAHTTCSVFYEEFSHDINDYGDEFLQEDLNVILRKIIPNHESASTYMYPGEEHYKEVESWPDAESYLPNGDRSALWNGDGHLKSTLIGNSVTLDIENGKLGVGSTGYVYFADFDTTRARERKFKVVILGQ
ncbi:YjbQ family protein [Aerococcaceae bacterium zg-ZJ1578]|uniref:YjbQ family protein n=1 Tax=Aerococcaceae bacterium zg-252 TaxID=2796928 RepID=UPI001A2A78DC|nr:YjbQ family protein [Aerococcaceae bacterium zg-1578]MBR7926819.1 YjbQ family protein [Aerococcaceae bacterium zg-ZUI334]